VLGVEGADHRLQNVGARHHALEDAVFVMHEPDVDGRVAQDRDHIAPHRGFRGNGSGPDGSARRMSGVFSREIDIQHVLGLHYAERLHRDCLSKATQREVIWFSINAAKISDWGSARSIMLTSCRGDMDGQRPADRQAA